MYIKSQSIFGWQKRGKALFLIFSVGIFLPLLSIVNIDFFNISLIEKLATITALGFYLFVVLFFVVELYSICNVVFRKKSNKLHSQDNSPFQPFVSIHIPTCSEPPDLVINTLRHLLKLKYKNYEIIVIDNNTKDVALWKPVSDFCRVTDKKLRFYHIEELDGFKAGALNFAITKTNKKAEIIAIIDSDYFVKPTFLQKTIPYFQDSHVGVVQMPQHYRHAKGIFKESMYYAYRYFFSIAMNSANVFQAATFTGTMGLIRRSLLNEENGWNTGCITEDIEFGVRVLKEGYNIIYIDEPGGKGYMPWEFKTYKTQRYRWVFGNGQVLRSFLVDNIKGKFDNLPLIIRVVYLYLITVWFNLIGLLFVFLFLLLLINYAMTEFNFPLILILSTMIIEAIRKPVGLALYIRRYEGKSWSLTINTIITFSALWFPESFAWIRGLIEPEGVFWRTSKFKRKSVFLNNLQYAKEEVFLFYLAIVALILSINIQLEYVLGFLLCAILFSTTFWILWQFRFLKVK